MKILNSAIVFAIAFSSSLALAVEYDLEKITMSNGLKFKTEWQQCLAEIKISKHRVQFVPSRATDPECGIASALVCANYKIDKQKFSKLRSIRVSASTVVPSVGLDSKYGGRTGIGSEEFFVTADLPDLAPEAKGFYRSETYMSVSSVSPNQHSYLQPSIELAKGESAKSDIYMAFGLTKNLIHSAVFYLDQVQGKSAVLHVRSEIDAKSKFLKPTWSPMADKTHVSSFSWEKTMTIPTDRPKAPVVAEDPSVDVCWRTNNYDSITLENAQLVLPQIELGYDR